MVKHSPISSAKGSSLGWICLSVRARGHGMWDEGTHQSRGCLPRGGRCVTELLTTASAPSHWKHHIRSALELLSLRCTKLPPACRS